MNRAVLFFCTQLWTATSLEMSRKQTSPSERIWASQRWHYCWRQLRTIKDILPPPLLGGSVTRYLPIVELDVRALRAQQRRQKRHGEISQLTDAKIHGHGVARRIHAGHIWSYFFLLQSGQKQPRVLSRPPRDQLRATHIHARYPNVMSAEARASDRSGGKKKKNAIQGQLISATRRKSAARGTSPHNLSRDKPRGQRPGLVEKGGDLNNLWKTRPHLPLSWRAFA